MRFIKLLTIFVFSVVFSSAQDVNSQIKNSSQTLANKELEEKKLNRQLDEIAKSLKKEESELAKTDKNIALLNNKISEQQKNVTDTKIKIDDMGAQNRELIKKRDELEQNMTNLIAQEFAYMLIIDEGYIENSDAIVTNEFLKIISKQANEKFKEYSAEFLLAQTKIEDGTKKIANMQKSIAELEEQKKELSKLKIAKIKIVGDIEKEKNIYIEKIQTIQAQKKELKKTLESLKVLEEESKKTPEVDISSVKLTTDEKIRQLGSSYKSSKVKKYTGAKTISPLENYTVVQKFGDFIDPVYNIKIFNESVVLHSTKTNDEVKNVLDGKVIFAKDTQLLKNVVIVENGDGIHTIYAHLSRIAPTIKVGSKIKKGYVIGRIDKDLTFEVTQKNYHINPMDLIRK